jgi:hypothetical protein
MGKQIELNKWWLPDSVKQGDFGGDRGYASGMWYADSINAWVWNTFDYFYYYVWDEIWDLRYDLWYLYDWVDWIDYNCCSEARRRG